MDPPSSPLECDADARKRVCKACDRCRIKKSKCDGRKPCSRCRNDDAICVFGGRKRKMDRVHPKGYVEILERQQKQLVNGIRLLYDRQVGGRAWAGPLPHNGYPPTHEILEYLGALEVEDTSDEEERGNNSHFEENVERLRRSVANTTNIRHSREGSCFDPNTKPDPLLPSQISEGYFSMPRFKSDERLPSPPRLSPDSLNTSRTSPSTSLDSHPWAGGEEHSWSTGFLGSVRVGKHDDQSALEESPIQGGFGDPFLMTPWNPDDLMYRS